MTEKQIHEVRRALQGTAMDEIMDEWDFLDVDFGEFNKVLDALVEKVVEGL